MVGPFGEVYRENKASASGLDPEAVHTLAIAAIVSIAIGEGTDAAFIGVVLVINALVGGPRVACRAE